MSEADIYLQREQQSKGKTIKGMPSVDLLIRHLANAIVLVQIMRLQKWGN